MGHLSTKSGTQPIISACRDELEEAKSHVLQSGHPPSPIEHEAMRRRYAERLESYLDSARGECWLKDDRVARVVVSTLRHFDGVRYRLRAWCVMPNHVHVVLTMLPMDVIQKMASPVGRQVAGGTRAMTPLATVLQSWKSYTAKEANRLLGRTGTFWQR
jgi:REP element-mobilizing transposase RayT